MVCLVTITWERKLLGAAAAASADFCNIYVCTYIYNMYLYIVISLSLYVCKILNIIPRISREFSVWSQLLSQSLTYIGRKKTKQNNNNNHHNILKNKIKSICTKLKLFCYIIKTSIPSKKTFFTDFVVVWIFGDYYTAICGQQLYV